MESGSSVKNVVSLSFNAAIQKCAVREPLICFNLMGQATSILAFENSKEVGKYSFKLNVLDVMTCFLFKFNILLYTGRLGNI